MARKKKLTAGQTPCEHETVTAVYDYLRRNRQVQRNVGEFDRDVKHGIEQILSRLLVEYGAYKD